MLSEIIFYILIHGISQNHLKVLSISQTHQTVLRIHIRNQMMNQIIKQWTTFENLLYRAVAHFLHLFVSWLTDKFWQCVIAEEPHAAASAQVLLVLWQRILLLCVVEECKLLGVLFLDPQDYEAGLLDDHGPRVTELNNQQWLQNSLHPRNNMESDGFPHELVGHLTW